MTKHTEIEAGDIVEVVAVADHESKFALCLHGTFDMEWVKDGITTYTVTFDGTEEFAYATEIKFVKKG